MRNLEEPSLDNLALPLIEEPDVLCLGTRPAYAAYCIGLLKEVGSGDSAKIEVAVVLPIPPGGVLNQLCHANFSTIEKSYYLILMYLGT